ncbi:MAG: hypothetical protein JST54_03945 [Deltaproteobacteria bacterium]|nr:hypothetical protein [Deltaproteobacteria bacterium]
MTMLIAGCPQAPVTPPTPDQPDAAPRAALQAFLEAQQQGDFAKAYALLSAPLRARYTPERLQADYARDHALADDKLARIRAALASGTPLDVHGADAALLLGEGRAVHLVDERGAWHVANLE